MTGQGFNLGTNYDNGFLAICIENYYDNIHVILNALILRVSDYNNPVSP